MALISKCIIRRITYLEPIELEFKNSFRLWYLSNSYGPAIMMTTPDATLKRCIENKDWSIDHGTGITYPVNSPYLSKLFGILTPLVRKELQKYSIPKWEDEPIEIELSSIKIIYY